MISRLPQRSKPTTYGVWTSRAGSARPMERAAIRSRSVMRSAVICCAVRPLRVPTTATCIRSLRQHFVSSGCPRSARTMVCHSHRPELAACRGWRCGGSSSGLPAVDRSGQAATERAPRTHAPHAQGRDSKSAGCHLGRAAALLRPLRSRVQCRSPARGVGVQDPGLALSPVCAFLSLRSARPVYADDLAVAGCVPTARSNGVAN